MPTQGKRGWAIYATHQRRAAARASQDPLHPDLADPPGRDGWTPDDWATPWPLVRELEQEFGPFELDPCATPASAKAPQYFTVDVDGLAQLWTPARVFLNPPFSDVVPWLRKAVQESKHGALVVSLLPAKTDRAWFHDLVLPYAEVRCLRGRLHFIGADGTTTGRPLFAGMLAIYPRGGL